MTLAQSLLLSSHDPQIHFSTQGGPFPYSKLAHRTPTTSPFSPTAVPHLPSISECNSVLTGNLCPAQNDGSAVFTFDLVAYLLWAATRLPLSFL